MFLLTVGHVMACHSMVPCGNQAIRIEDRFQSVSSFIPDCALIQFCLKKTHEGMEWNSWPLILLSHHISVGSWTTRDVLITDTIPR